MEKLTFNSSTKRWLIPRYKLMIAVKTLCERGVPFKLVPANKNKHNMPILRIHRQKKPRRKEV